MSVYLYPLQFRQDGIQVVIAFACILGIGSFVIAEVPIAGERVDEQLVSVVQLGEAIVKSTTSHPLSKDFVGNS